MNEANATPGMASETLIVTSQPQELRAAPAAEREVGGKGALPPPVTDLGRRRRWVAAWRRLLADALPRLLDSIQRETGRPREEALVADLLPLLAACRWHERNVLRLLRPRRLSGRVLWLPGQKLVEHRAPLGRVAIIATWNYPVQLLGVQLLQAVAAGNSVVVKPSEVVPLTQTQLLELAARAAHGVGLPADTIVWTEATREAGQALLRDRRFDHILFTGSTRVGAAIAEIAAQSLTPSTLELSGSDSAIVLADADVDLAARSIWAAVTMNAGQTCMAPRRVLVERAVFTKFVAALAPLAAGARPLRLVSEAAAAQAFAAAQGAYAAGGRSASAVLEPNDGPWLRPLAIVEGPRSGDLYEGQHFGPVIAVNAVADAEEALRLHLAQPRRLSLSIFSRRTRLAKALARQAQVALVTVNDCVRPLGHPAAVLGGRGESGWGVSRGEDGLLAMTRPSVVCVSHRWFRAPAQAPSGERLRLLERATQWLYRGWLASRGR